MKCDRCGEKTKVFDSGEPGRRQRLHVNLGNSYVRQRVCKSCKYKFTTYELSVDSLKLIDYQLSKISDVKSKVGNSIKDLNVLLSELDCDIVLRFLETTDLSETVK